MREILPLNINIDFVGRRYFFAGLSGLLMLVSMVLLVVVGPNWSIDFTGGTEVQVHFKDSTTVSDVRAALAPLGIGEDSVQSVGGVDGTYLVRVQGAASANEAEIEQVKSALTAAFGAEWLTDMTVDAEVGTRATITYAGTPVELSKLVAALAGLPEVKVQDSAEENVFYVRMPGVAEQIRDTLATSLSDRSFEIEKADSVGPKVGGNLRQAGISSLFITMGILMIYVAFRFDFSFAPGAILCLFHDALLTLGVFVVTREEFGLSMVSAILTLVGYSLNDTIVVYDRIRENMEKYRKADLAQLINDSINQTLSRSIVTSGATALALIPFLFLGGPILNSFARTMLLGMLFGSYSTIYIASPLMLLLKEYQPRFMAIFASKSVARPG